MLVIIDYNLGNLQSVQSGFEKIGLPCVISRNKEIIEKADALILPGVGSFSVAMENLARYDLIDLVRARVKAGVLLLGICLGMQILFEKGYENGETLGLGLIKGTVEPIVTDEKLPHMGWNQLHILQQKHPLVKNLVENDEVYFVHSYQANCKDENIIAVTDYGQARIPAIVSHQRVLGCQFHPEKSSRIGQLILQAFKAMIEEKVEV